MRRLRLFGFITLFCMGLFGSTVMTGCASAKEEADEEFCQQYPEDC